MSLSSSNSGELAEVLEATRRNIRQLEMDTYRVRTDLTRLEVALVTSLPDAATASPAQYGATEAPLEKQRAPVRIDALATTPAAPASEVAEPIVAPIIDAEWLSASKSLVHNDADFLGSPLPMPAEVATPNSDPTTLESEASQLSSTSVLGNRVRKTYRYITSPVVASLVLHGAIMLMIVSMTVATIVHTQKPFTATVVDLGNKPPSQIENIQSLDLGQISPLDETNLQSGFTDSPQLASDAPIVSEVTPVDFESVAGPPSLGDLGLMSSTPTDLGTVLQGNGGLGEDGEGAPKGLGTGNQRGGKGGSGEGRKVGVPGSALFFGTKSKGDRFVFVIDNSSSMKGGRLEMALAELVKTVESLSPKQSFYVIFVSDQTYPMFYPTPELDLTPATPPNKKRLTEWLPKAILASGNNRKLIQAMDMAAALRPHAVYLLWDGDMRYSENVRLDVMTHLTAPNLWNFTVHTLGIGVTSLDSEQNLTAIAQAHGGMFRRIDLPTARKR